MDSVLSSFIVNLAQPRVILEEESQLIRCPLKIGLWANLLCIFLIDNGCGKPNHCGQNHPWDGGLGAIMKLAEQAMERKPVSGTLPWLLQSSLLFQ